MANEKSIKKLWVYLTGDTTDLDAKIAKGDKEAAKQREKFEEDRAKIRNLWTYGNQVFTMLLQSASRALGNIKSQAAIQQVLAGIQRAQTQTAIAQTILDAAAAFAIPGGLSTAQGILLLTIAGSMEALEVKSIANEIDAKVAQRQATEIQRQIEAYRSG